MDILVSNRENNAIAFFVYTKFIINIILIWIIEILESFTNLISRTRQQLDGTFLSNNKLKI